MANMARGGGFFYQRDLSLYLYMLMKKTKYVLKKSKKYNGEDFSLFVRKMKKFKDKCINHYGKDFNLKVELLIEGDEKCLDDITLISNNKLKEFDNNIFIQVKTKGEGNIGKTDGILKAVKNFINNINFQKDKYKNNIIFFIFVNKDLTRPLLKEIRHNHYKLYIPFIDYIINKKTFNIYPTKTLNKLYGDLNNLLIKDILNKKNIFILKYEEIYGKEYLGKLKLLTEDLKIIFYNLEIVTKISKNILVNELKEFYGKDFFSDEKERIEGLVTDGIEIKPLTPEFERYEKYQYTYFKSENGGQFINEIDVITDGKFI